MADAGPDSCRDRDAALAGALELFWAKGYEGASTDNLSLYRTMAGAPSSPAAYAGVGAAIVRKRAEQGATVAFTYSANAEAAQSLAADIKGSGTQAPFGPLIELVDGGWR